VTAPRFLPLYFSFAAAYVLSYTYRTANAVISPELSASLNIGASSLGLLTSAYFVAFAAMQIPAGMLLDRYGPRRVEPILLTVAGCGALAFAASDTLIALDRFHAPLPGAPLPIMLLYWAGQGGIAGTALGTASWGMLRRARGRKEAHESRD